ncbi:VOC family protein [Flagellimonas sp.]|jgi:lactoylglutathione lyase|uniref:VOC family protein n=1 Tax=Flagellimonas sp. TaxID=2058762 RepID=UPI000B75CD2A|nr:MAG: glyoxalase/bleomycin resistance/extradiol dioxygenase family protein [Muricauda sp. TMED12]|tara:strand:- start:72840 stop:73298 length:459 start_codon:yes stop_codon:yes gene_type:complete
MRLAATLVSIIIFLSYSCNSRNDDFTTLRLELFTSDMQKSVDFYTGILGFQMEGKKINSAYQPVKRDNVILGIGPIGKLGDDHHFKPHLKHMQKGYGVEIVLEVDDIRSVYEQVKASGYPIHDSLKTQPWGLTDFRLVDPDGYYLRVTSKQE